MGEQEKNAWAARQISLRQSSRIHDETKQPFKPGFSDPERCTLFDTRDEIERGADTQRQTAGDAAPLEFLRDDFLLRRTNGQKAEPEGTAFLDRAQAGFDLYGVANEIHRRINMAQGFEAETRPKLLSLCRAPGHHHRNIVRFDHAGHHRGCQIAARTDAMALSLEGTAHIRHKMAVQKPVCGLLVQCAKLMIVVMTNHMIDVGRDDVAEALTPECGHNCARFGEFVVIDRQNVGHVISPQMQCRSLVLDGAAPPRLRSPQVSVLLADQPQPQYKPRIEPHNRVNY